MSDQSLILGMKLAQSALYVCAAAACVVCAEIHAEVSPRSKARTRTIFWAIAAFSLTGFYVTWSL